MHGHPHEISQADRTESRGEVIARFVWTTAAGVVAANCPAPGRTIPALPRGAAWAYNTFEHVSAGTPPEPAGNGLIQ